jgi:hypothetical protein
MNQVSIVKGIVRGYFAGALALSATHTIHSFEKLGLDTGEQYVTPLAIDGIAILGLIMRGEKWSTDTRKIGLRIQIGAGALQLAANVYAASSTGGMILGVLVVALYLLAEWLSGRMVTRDSELAAEALAEALSIARAEEARVQAEKDARNEAARVRRQAARTAKHSAEVSEARRIGRAKRNLQTA